MRKFRFVGDPRQYTGLELNQVYFGNFELKDWVMDVQGFFDKYPEDWEEVTEAETVIKTGKPLHKDTDLGYFAGLIMQALISDKEMSVKIAAELAIETAKELIKRLDNETGRRN